MWKPVIALLVSVIVAMLAVSCDEDCPTCPPPPSNAVSDYDVYLDVNDSISPIYVYNTARMMITDSFYLPGVDPAAIEDIAVSGDGRHLLAAVDLGTAYQMVVYDLASGQVIASPEAGKYIEVSDNGRHIASYGDNRLYFFSGRDYSLEFSVPIATSAGRFGFGDNRFYCVRDSFDICIFSLTSQALDTVIRIVDEFGEPVMVELVQPNTAATRLYALGLAYYYQYDRRLYGYDLDAGQIIRWNFICDLTGDIRLTPDGAMVIMSDPRTSCIDYGTTHLTFINTESGTTISELDGLRCRPTDSTSRFIAGRLIITPDGRYTVAAPAVGGTALGMIDNDSRACVNITQIRDSTGSNVLAACRKFAE